MIIKLKLVEYVLGMNLALRTVDVGTRVPVITAILSVPNLLRCAI